MKKLISILPFLILPFLLLGCQPSAQDNQNDEPIDSSPSITTEEKEVSTNQINQSSSVADLEGKPSVIIFGGTYCPHCVAAIPILKKEIWDIFKDDINIWVNVIDKKKFDVEDVPQGFNPNYTFEGLAGEECKYVPSWVVLDVDRKVVISSCGGKKGIDEMKKEIENLL